ncbi:MAG: dihydropteroate synthase [Bacteroidetes bacterium]|nr:MAG: dihydropteroate synthase [Bacteroidota bacterium]
MVNSRVEDKQFPRIKRLKLGDKILDLSIPRVMGILNVTPDSFYDQSRVQSESQALKLAEKMISEGADILDLGAYSSRPGSLNVEEKEEIARITPIVRALKKEFPSVPISVDTFRSEVAKSVLNEGIEIINDIGGGLLDPEMFSVISSSKAAYILMHMRGNPQTMQKQANYSSIFSEVASEISDQLSKAKTSGIHDIILDPGFGFSKNVEQNFELMKYLPELGVLGRPVLVGISRKSMIYKTLDITTEESLNGTTVLNTISLLKGADLLRVHDVREARQIITLLDNFS